MTNIGVGWRYMCPECGLILQVVRAASKVSAVVAEDALYNAPARCICGCQMVVVDPEVDLSPPGCKCKCHVSTSCTDCGCYT